MSNKTLLRPREWLAEMLRHDAFKLQGAAFQLAHLGTPYKNIDSEL